MTKPTVLITGAGRGIGRAAAIELASLGYEPLLVSRTESELRQTSQLAGSGRIFVADVANAEQVQRLIDSASKEAGRIDAIVHCAGLAPMQSIDQMTPAQWQSVIDTNLSAAFYLCKAAWPIFKAQKSGVIVNISSEASRDPFDGFAAYGAAKAGLNLFGRVAAREGIGARHSRSHDRAGGGGNGNAAESADARAVSSGKSDEPPPTSQR